MGLKFFNGIQIDVPDDWADLSTVILAPKSEAQEGKKPSINLVVKRRPAKGKDVAATVREYLGFMKGAFGALENVETKQVVVGAVKGTAVRFRTEANGKKFTQVTLLYRSGGDEISATVTQLEGDPTPMVKIEKLLQSIRPAAGGLAGIR
ncbi:MAG: DcrB-related protein [Deltaproteobacteria bacterium]|nr:DcrB-related protein [Deltaproteobacteria bacterium]